MKKLSTILLIVLMSLSTIQAKNGSRDRDGNGRIERNNPEFHQRNKGDRGLGRLLKDKKLNLTEKQTTKIKKLYKDHRSESIDFRAKIEKLKLKSEDDFEVKTYNAKKLRLHSKEMGELIQKMMNNRLEFIISIIEVLDEKQKEYALPLIGKYMRGFRGPHDPKDKPFMRHKKENR